jgi:hypothetical protein
MGFDLNGILRVSKVECVEVPQSGKKSTGRDGRRPSRLEIVTSRTKQLKKVRDHMVIGVGQEGRYIKTTTQRGSLLRTHSVNALSVPESGEQQRLVLGGLRQAQGKEEWKRNKV